MAGRIEARLAELGIVLPKPAAPAANYVPWVISGTQVFVAGQVTIGAKGIEYVGKLGRDFTVEEGQAAARLCAINLLAQVASACGGDLDRVTRCLRLGVFINCTDDFVEQPKVANGASDLMVAVLGDAGRHARAAVGSNALPLGVAVEVDGVFEIQ